MDLKVKVKSRGRCRGRAFPGDQATGRPGAELGQERAAPAAVGIDHTLCQTMPDAMSSKAKRSESCCNDGITRTAIGRGRGHGRRRTDADDDIRPGVQYKIGHQSGINPDEQEQKGKKIQLLKRPGHGTAGRPIPLVTNYFALKFNNVLAFHYDVDILDGHKKMGKGKSVVLGGKTAKEDRQQKVGHAEHEQKRTWGKEKCRQIIFEMVKHEALEKYNPVYDGQKNIFTSEALPFKKKTTINVEIEVEGRRKTYYIVIQPVQKKNGNNIISLEPLRKLYTGNSTEIPQEVLLVYDTVMNHRDPPFYQKNILNCFFSLNQEHIALGSGLETWFGYNQSVKLAEVGPVLVVNLAAKAFHKAGSVIDYACDILQTDITTARKLQSSSISEIENALKGVRVKVTHQKHPRKYKIKGVSQISASDLTFQSGSRKMSVKQYFKEQYQYQLKYPFLPCLHMQTINPSTYIPMEVCEVVEGQAKLGKLNADLTSKMIKQTAVRPRERFDSIMEHGKAIKRTSKNKMAAFGLLMDVQFLKVDGRVICAPDLEYGGTKSVTPNTRGTWRIEDGKQFYKSIKINAWILISFASDRFCSMDKLLKCADCLVSSSRKCGLRCGPPVEIKIFDQKTTTDEALKYAVKTNVDFAIVVLPKKDKNQIYEKIKFKADFIYGLVTQCMKEETVNRINSTITTNICLKINVKLGGINHKLLTNPQVFERPVIIFGADVIHWTRGFGYPSIAAVVGSLDRTASRYALRCCLQDQEKDKLSQEIIKNMKNIVKEILGNFQAANNGIKPEKIIFFRDGVSEGQFVTVIEQEVSGIQAACQELYDIYLPITYIVVQKRHQTRLRPVNIKDGIGKSGNVPPGTVVDTTITHPVIFDFYVCSHEGIQGTSKPAHYTVLHDDNKLSPDELQQLSYFLCYTYAKCTRSVSVPSPIVYADLAATRAKKYADCFIRNEMRNSDELEPMNRPLPQDVVRAIDNMKSFGTNMFYA